ncbi:DNA ligase [Pseudothauera rhizosphaerae]|uniref:DNA ligase n=2 Tax=Pseudothauera rhizosphaerae TaxID=2565932 RepID=A0A4S4APA9_9RHOO|nr:DNA ligase [Pseudothauera rhizosphaerae]
MPPHFRSIVLALLLAAGWPSSVVAEAPAPAVMLAERYRTDIDPAAYWVSEKLDGVRAIWDGHGLRLRSGAAIAAPAWFVAALPPEPLDGELWMGRRSFDRLSGLIRRNAPDDPAWREVRYMIFDLPGAAGDFSARLARLRRIVDGRGAAWLQAVPQHRVANHSALQRRFEETVRGGGEGLMLHRADAQWMPGRSSALLKLTPWQDAEARVLAHLPGKGRLRGMTGSLLVETPDGRRFRLGSGLTDALRRDPPPLGTLVTYRYRDLTPSGLPRFPRFLRPRDLP